MALACFAPALAHTAWAQQAVSSQSPPPEAVALFHAGRAALAKDDIEGALKLFQQSLALNRSGGVLLNLANCEEKLGHLVKALQYYREVVQFLPETDIRVPRQEKASPRWRHGLRRFVFNSTHLPHPPR
ncbi:MAG: tetratricopeptide repeat protein [Polyangiaceae bacterium]